MKNKKTIRSVLVSLGAFTIISAAFAFFGYKDTTQEGSVSAGDDTEKSILEKATQSELSVLENKCRGCGKCARVDPEHFALDVENGLAIVVSTNNLDSNSLQRAVNVCHDGAIVIL
ncbi:MAG: ferredoxin [Candidatus Pacebacteria bacterium]|nr:ferredoxin [Candidatus Paceibacterota bacterium]